MDNPIILSAERSLHSPTAHRFIIERFIFIRWLIAILLILASYFANNLLKIPINMNIIWVITGSLIALNFLYWLWIKLMKENRLRFITHFQIILDLVLLTLVIHYTGGIENPFLLLFVLHTVISGTLLKRTWCFLYAVFSIVIVGLMALSEYYGLVPHYSILPVSFYNNPISILGIWLSFCIADVGIAYFVTLSVENYRNTKAALEKANIELEERDQTRIHFVRYVTHELKAPLAAIQSMIQAMKEVHGALINEKIRYVFDRIETRTANLLDLVSELLVVSQHIATNIIPLKRVPVNLNRLINDIVEFQTSSAKPNNITIQLQLDNTIEEVSLDFEAMRKIIVNLISNAIRYSKPNSVVHVGTEFTDDEIIISVLDHGIGIPDDDIDHIFNEFYRAKNAVIHSKQGTGLGLTITKKLIESHGGTITVSSKQNVGTRFEVRIPIQQ
jgi:signal transduction histidine kinase